MSAPLTAAAAFEVVKEWAATRKGGGKGWGVVWDPLARGTHNHGEGGPCQVVHNHDGGAYDVRSWGDTWEEALKRGRIPLPSAPPAAA